MGVSTICGGQDSRFRFAAVFGAGNEVGIGQNISVGYKGKFTWFDHLAGGF